MKNKSNVLYGAITEPAYWESSWSQMDIPDAIDPNDDAPENHYYKVMHELFTREIGGHCAINSRLIEIGCGGSRWLPYFHRTFGCDVSGIDYTASGIQLSEAIFNKAGVHGRIVQADLFEPPPDMIELFDVVVSFGLVEHFEDAVQVVSACARYLRPGGRMLTLVPTMQGLYGQAYRLFRPDVYRKHIPHSRESLLQAHSDAGLSITYCDYVLGLPAVISAPRSANLLGRIAFAASQQYWKLERAGYGIPPNRYTSPYAVCVAIKSNIVQS